MVAAPFHRRRTFLYGPCPAGVLPPFSQVEGLYVRCLPLCNHWRSLVGRCAPGRFSTCREVWPPARVCGTSTALVSGPCPERRLARWMADCIHLVCRVRQGASRQRHQQRAHLRPPERRRSRRTPGSFHRGVRGVPARHAPPRHGLQRDDARLLHRHRLPELRGGTAGAFEL